MRGLFRRACACCLTIVLIAACASPTSGQITIYTNQSAFDAALVPGSATNPYPGLPAADFTTPIAPQRYVLGTPYASYTAYCVTGMFFDNYYGGTVPGIGNFQFSQPLFVDFGSHNVRQVGASFFWTDFFGTPDPTKGNIIVQFFDGSSTTVPIVTGIVRTTGWPAAGRATATASSSAGSHATRPGD